jgi:hypothetical protein
LYLPTIGVQLHVESVSLLRNVQLIANGPAQSLEGWSRLESALKTTLRPVSGQRNLYGASLVLCGLLILVGLTAYAINDYETVVQSLNEMLHVGEQ